MWTDPIVEEIHKTREERAATSLIKGKPLFRGSEAKLSEVIYDWADNFTL